MNSKFCCRGHLPPAFFLCDQEEGRVRSLSVGGSREEESKLGAEEWGWSGEALQKEQCLQAPALLGGPLQRVP